VNGINVLKTNETKREYSLKHMKKRNNWDKHSIVL